MRSEEVAYFDLCCAIWEAGWRLWRDRWMAYSGIARQMAIIVSAPDAFFDAEPWAFDLVINAADGSGPLDLTGSRLYASFRSLSDNMAVGACDTTGTDGSLTITDAPAGKVRFRVPNAGRTQRLPAIAPGALMLRSTVVGDLYRLAGGDGAAWDAIARIEIGVLPSTGLPTP